MKKRTFILLFLFLPVSQQQQNITWLREHSGIYNLNYSINDTSYKKEYKYLINKGVNSVEYFFNVPFMSNFEVFIHPGRASIDRQWADDWKIPGFRSECWMVASGVAGRLDMISPFSWKSEACEHDPGDSVATQRLIAHELFHVFHGQINISDDFSDLTGLDWFVEGLATYASGQCDSLRLEEVKQALIRGEIPASLDSFWTGKIKYGLSGSVVMFIDKKYGRNKLRDLLIFKSKSDLLKNLQISEEELLGKWKSFILAR